MVAGRSAKRAGSDKVVPGRAAALYQLESGALQPEEGSALSACGDRFIVAKASSEDRRVPSLQQHPGGNTPHTASHKGGNSTQGKLYPPINRSSPNFDFATPPGATPPALFWSVGRRLWLRSGG